MTRNQFELKPKGLEIWRHRDRKANPFSAVIKGKGRTGSAARFRFTRLSPDRRQALMHGWWQRIFGERP